MDCSKCLATSSHGSLERLFAGSLHCPTLHAPKHPWGGHSERSPDGSGEVDGRGEQACLDDQGKLPDAVKQAFLNLKAGNGAEAERDHHGLQLGMQAATGGQDSGAAHGHSGFV